MKSTNLCQLFQFASVAIGGLVLAAGCAAGPAPVAYENRVFYEYDAAGGDTPLSDLLERPVDELDGELSSSRPLEGVEVLDGVARFSRPADWRIRRGSLKPQERFIEYVSPRQIVFSIYERIESPEATWTDLLARYESETKEQGGVIETRAVPTASFNSQGRAYDVLRGVPAGKEPFVAYSREYLFRSENRVVLVQVVRPREDFGVGEQELLAAVQSLRVM